MQLTQPELAAAMQGIRVSMRESSLVKAAQLPLHLLQPETATASTPLPGRPTAQPMPPMPPMTPRPPGPVANGLPSVAEPSPPAPPPRPQATSPEIAPRQSRVLEMQDDAVVLSQLSR